MKFFVVAASFYCGIRAGSVDEKLESLQNKKTFGAPELHFLKTLRFDPLQYSLAASENLAALLKGPYAKVIADFNNELQKAQNTVTDALVDSTMQVHPDAMKRSMGKNLEPIKKTLQELEVKLNALPIPKTIALFTFFKESLNRLTTLVEKYDYKNNKN